MARKSAENRYQIDIANSREVCFGPISVVDGQNPASAIISVRRFRECLIVRFVRSHRALLALSGAVALLALAQPAAAGMELSLIHI